MEIVGEPEFVHECTGKYQDAVRVVTKIIHWQRLEEVVEGFPPFEIYNGS